MHFPRAPCCNFHTFAIRGPDVEDCGLSACLDLHHYARGNSRDKDERRSSAESTLEPLPFGLQR